MQPESDMTFVMMRLKQYDLLQFSQGSSVVLSEQEGGIQLIQSLDDALTKCQTLGMRLSRQRRSILELLWQAQEHLSARQIYNRLNQDGKDIGHTSVYQNLEALSQQGIIECVERSDGRLYGHISDSHSHVNCLDTDQILDIYVQLPDTLIAEIEQRTGIKITDYRVDFYGYRQSAVTLSAAQAV